MRKKVERKTGYSFGPQLVGFWEPSAVSKRYILYGGDGNKFLEYRRHAYIQLIMDFGNGD